MGVRCICHPVVLTGRGNFFSLLLFFPPISGLTAPANCASKISISETLVNGLTAPSRSPKNIQAHFYRRGPWAWNSIERYRWNTSTPAGSELHFVSGREASKQTRAAGTLKYESSRETPTYRKLKIYIPDADNSQRRQFRSNTQFPMR